MVCLLIDNGLRLAFPNRTLAGHGLQKRAVKKVFFYFYPVALLPRLPNFTAESGRMPIHNLAE